MSETKYERVGAAAVLTITRPERRNAVDAATAEGLRRGFDAFEADDDARVLILTGEGPEAFCAGADLKALAEAVAAGIDPLDWLPRFADGPLGFTRLQASKPTIAAISGWCLAGGLELALWCDLRIATEDAKLGFTERRFGVPLIDGGTQRLPRIVGMGRALEMILTGRILETEEAHAWGLLNEVVAPGDPPGARARDGRGAGRLPADNDALGPPGRDRGHRDDLRRWDRARGRAWVAHRLRPARRARLASPRAKGRGGAGAGV